MYTWVFECLVSYYCVSYSKLHAAFPVRAIHPDFAACIPRQRYNGQWKLEKPLFLLHAWCSYVSGLSLHRRHPLKGTESRVGCEEWRKTEERREKRQNGEGWSKKVKSLLCLCPAPVARPLLPPTTQPRSLGKSWATSTKALCVHLFVCMCVRTCVCLHVFCGHVCTFTCQVRLMLLPRRMQGLQPWALKINYFQSLGCTWWNSMQVPRSITWNHSTPIKTIRNVGDKKRKCILDLSSIMIQKTFQSKSSLLRKHKLLIVSFFHNIPKHLVNSFAVESSKHGANCVPFENPICCLDKQNVLIFYSVAAAALKSKSV